MSAAVAAETPGAQVWIDPGARDCDGEPRWEDRDGRRTFTCPECSLHWYIVLPGSDPAATEKRPGSDQG